MARKTMRRAGAWIGLGAFTAGAGAVVGFGIWLLLDVAYWLLDLVWKNGVDALGIAWLPVVVCAVGGVCIGLWNKRFHCAPKPFNEVISDVKRTGGYHLGRVAPSAVAFLLPIAFGGSVGPEAGLMGLIAAGCTWVGERMRAMGVRLGVMHEGEDFSKAAKRTLYVVGTAGGVAGVVAVIALVGSGMSIPRFEAVAFGIEPLLLAVPLALGGYALGLLYLAVVRGAQALHERFDRHVVLMPTLVGLALGTAAVFLPYVLFPGSQQASELDGRVGGHVGRGASTHGPGQDRVHRALPEPGMERRAVLPAHLLRHQLRLRRVRGDRPRPGAVRHRHHRRSHGRVLPPAGRRRHHQPAGVPANEHPRTRRRNSRRPSGPVAESARANQARAPYSKYAPVWRLHRCA